MARTPNGMVGAATTTMNRAVRPRKANPAKA
jgi:hypothetical protein